MHIKLLEYIERYKFVQNPYTSFFTNQKSSELPGLVDIENFNKRLSKALNLDETICIYSDYDADAITATATMYWGLILLGFKKDKISYYAPDRFTEGYGMNTKAVEKLSLEYNLLISVDCGINSVEEARICLKNKEKGGADLIITDHHILSDKIPQALAVINPRLTPLYSSSYDLVQEREICFARFFEDQKFQKPTTSDLSNFVSTSVCGVGVAWFSLLHLADYLGKDKVQLNFLLAFVAIGTIADCQSILDTQNRLLVKAGIKLFQNCIDKYVGLRALVEKSGLMEKVKIGALSSQDLGYTLAPILNAAGRIDHAHLAIRLLCEENYENALEMADQIIAINQERKEMVKSAVLEIANTKDNENPLIFINSSFNKGIIGLIASKLCDKYQKPTVITSVSEGDKITASLRAPKGYNMVQVMSKIKSGLLDKFGGHPEAAGFSCKQVNVEQIELEFLRILKSYQPEKNAINKSYIPIEIQNIDGLHECNRNNIIFLQTKEVSDIFINDVFSLEPFSNDFPMPKILTKIETYNIVLMGKLQNHVRIYFNNLTLICFNISESNLDLLLKNKSFYVTINISKNVYNEKVSNQLIVDEIKCFC
jgi:single-stranded-DNA-specific exonuclease